jgi:hypothetical protein
MLEEDDPVMRALDEAPLVEDPATPEQRAELDERRARPVFVPGAVVSAKLVARRRRDEG